uniref:Uncharacterized protein n=1 Tax=Brassica oleracea TaxID=3712 RepID=A0A3P6EXE2_BRAOL|nr:unnamed protein product [Brassica oleracea]
MVPVFTDSISDHIRSPLEITSLERNLALYRATKQRRKLEVYTRGGVTGQPESLSHPGEANFQAPPKIVPPGTKDFPLVSSDYTKRLEPEPLRDTFYGHERTYTLERDVRRDAPSHPPKLHDMSERK